VTGLATSASIAALNDLSSAEAQAAAAAALTAYDAATGTDVTDGVAAVRGATGTETLDTLAADIAAVDAGSAPTVEEIDTKLTTEHGAGLWTSAVTGSGDVYVTDATLDDEGDDMAFETSGGAGIGGATVKAFVTSEYTAGTFTVRAQTVTADDGTWQDALLLNDGVQYTIEFSKDGYDAATTTVTPSA
jgi:hypothetical protein